MRELLKPIPIWIKYPDSVLGDETLPMFPSILMISFFVDRTTNNRVNQPLLGSMLRLIPLLLFSFLIYVTFMRDDGFH